MNFKKLTLVTSALLLSTAALAEAQVYEMTLTLKSTLTKKGKTAALVCSEPKNDTGLYRKQGSVKIKGLFWGCDCITIGDPQPLTTASATYGYIFWNQTTGKVLDGKFAWMLLNRIDKTLKKCEGTWDLAGDGFELVGGGFGTVVDVVDKECCTLDSTIIKTMNGNCAGYLSLPPTIVSEGTQEVCEKCEQIQGTDDVVAIAPAFTLCECGDASEITTATGTWRLKYHQSASSKWNKSSATEPITSVYGFPSYVVSYINAR